MKRKLYPGVEKNNNIATCSFFTYLNTIYMKIVEQSFGGDKRLCITARFLQFI